MALQFDIYILAPEDLHQTFDRSSAFSDATLLQRARQWTTFVARQADQPSRKSCDLFFARKARLILWHPQLHLRRQPTNVLISRPRRRNHWKPRRLTNCYFRSDM